MQIRSSQRLQVAKAPQKPEGSKPQPDSETPIAELSQEKVEFKGKKGYDEGEIEVTMKAPLSHKIIAGAGVLGVLGCLGRVALQVAQEPTTTGKVIAGAGALAAGVAGYAAADLSSGFFHHFIDNYPKKPDVAKPGELTWNTPVIGDIAAEFQVHHHFTRDMENVPFISNLRHVGQVMGPVLLGLAAFGPSAAVTAAGGAFAAASFLGQGYHRWAHEPNPPKIAKFLQKTGIAQSKQDHFNHHRMPWSDNYCIINGMWNPVLTNNDFWRKWEGAIYKVTGAEPNSWRDPGVKELALGEIDKAEFLERRKDDKRAFKQTVKDAGEREALMYKLHGQEHLANYQAPD